MDKPPKHKSIGERLRKAKSLEASREVGLEWAASWRNEYDRAIDDLHKSIRGGRLTDIAASAALLHEHTDKRLGALPNVVEKLTDEDI